MHLIHCRASNVPASLPCSDHFSGVSKSLDKLSNFCHQFLRTCYPYKEVHATGTGSPAEAVPLHRSFAKDTQSPNRVGSDMLFMDSTLRETESSFFLQTPPSPAISYRRKSVYSLRTLEPPRSHFFLKGNVCVTNSRQKQKFDQRGLALV